MACVYVLYSALSKKYYMGSSREETPTKRLLEHNGGNVRSTKAGRPWVIAYLEKAATYTEARQKEIFLKSGQGRLWIKQNVRRDA